MITNFKRSCFDFSSINKIIKILIACILFFKLPFLFPGLNLEIAGQINIKEVIATINKIIFSNETLQLVVVSSLIVTIFEELRLDEINNNLILKDTKTYELVLKEICSDDKLDTSNSFLYSFKVQGLRE